MVNAIFTEMPSRLDPSELHAIAAQRGGKCLSTSYTNIMDIYLWECGSCGKQWESNFNNIKHHNSWCPHCRTSTREQVVRAAFQECLPGEEFATDRTVIGMELDGYSHKYAIAFEHDGIQHRVRVEHFQRTEEEFHAQVARDRQKDQRCYDNWIVLIRVPDRGVLPLKEIRAYVREQLLNVIDLAPKTCSDKEFLDRAVIAAHTKRNYIPDIQGLVGGKGILLSQLCPTRDYSVSIRCSQGHVFTSNYDNLERGRWCPQCAHNWKLSDSDLAQLVSDAGYEFAGVESRKDGSGRSRRYIRLRCSTHGESEQTLDNFRKRKICAKCALGKRSQSKCLDGGSIEKNLALAGFKLASPYINNSTLMEFMCAAGHTFRTTYAKVTRKGSQCPGCVVAGAYPLQLRTAPARPYEMLEKYDLVCTMCGQESETTPRGLMIRANKSGYYCRHKKCPSRS